MEKKKLKNAENNKAYTNRFIKQIESGLYKWADSISVIDLSNRKIKTLDENVAFPVNLSELNISHNFLTEVPQSVLNLKHIEVLDVSSNSIKFFDDTPSFSETITYLNISHNVLLGPPYWVWYDCPPKLAFMDLSGNVKISNSFQTGYLQELLEYQAQVRYVKMYNCQLRDCLEFLSTFSHTTTLELGTSEYSALMSNCISDFPCQGLDKCCEIQKLNLNNVLLYNIKPTIDIYTHLIELDVSGNRLHNLPKEFCNLVNLEVCILSNNNLLYFPEEMHKMKKLTVLLVDYNELCMLPENIAELQYLRILDVYDNKIYDLPERLECIEEIDLAQNFLEEPDDDWYNLAKGRLRLKKTDRFDGRKITQPPSEYSSNRSEDYEMDSNSSTCAETNHQSIPQEDWDAIVEDWDSDDYWVPRVSGYVPPSKRSTWLNFVEQKMKSGNFCPMDMHTVPVAEKVAYEKMCHPKIQHESDGQFDDYSEDDS